MMNEPATNTDNETEEPLRFTRPELYDQLIEEFQKYHIHLYDVESVVIEKENGLELILRFGDGFTQSTRCYLSHEALHSHGELSVFFKQSAESCQKAMIADYYKMMKP